MADARGKERDMGRELHKMEPKYEVYVRLPFNRGDFVDPPPVDWNDSKSDALWNIISDVERTERKIDWSELAASFGVGVDFLLMMAQTLAERHTNQLMGLFRKAAAVTGTSGAASPVNAGFPSNVPAPDATPSPSDSMRRTASGSSYRPSSPTSIRKNSPLPRTDMAGTPGAGTPLKTSLTAIRPSLTSRSATPSAAPTVLAQNIASGVSQDLSPPPPTRPKSPPVPRHRPSALHLSTTSPPSGLHSPERPPSGPAKSDSASSSSSGSSSPVESRIIKRPPRSHAKSAPSTSLFPSNADDNEGYDEEEDEEEAEPAFLPYRSPPASTGSSDLGATLRGAPPPSSSSSRRHPPGASSSSSSKAMAAPSREGTGSGVSDHRRRAPELRESQTSDSSAGSAAVGGQKSGSGGGGGGSWAVRGSGSRGGRIGPLSPRRTAELAGKGKGKGREGSDGTPSMGSSFSDLDDASVTQSALEEALASNMQDGAATVGSRMSTFGNAFKSRYLPKVNR